jgi:hypothetical protein
MPDASWFASALFDCPPSEYLRERLRTYAVSQGRPDEFDTLAGKGAKFGGVELRWEAVPVDRPEGGMSAAERFALMEAAALLHQTAETVWLWFLAAGADDPAPWFAIPETHPKRLRDAIRAFEKQPEASAAAAISGAFLGASGPEGVWDCPSLPEWTSAVRALRGLMLWFARPVQNAAAYNALKHGAVGVAGRHRLDVEVDGETIEWAAGQTLTALRPDGKAPSGESRWRMEQRWYSPEVCMAATVFGSSLIDLIWQSTRQRVQGTRRPPIDYGRLAQHTYEVLQGLDDSHFANSSTAFRFDRESRP